MNYTIDCHQIHHRLWKTLDEVQTIDALENKKVVISVLFYLSRGSFKDYILTDNLRARKMLYVKNSMERYL